MKFLSFVTTARSALFIPACLLFGTAARSGAAQQYEAISFAVEPGQLYLPLNEAADALRWRVETDQSGRCKGINGMAVAAGSLRCLTDGTELVSAAALASAGAQVTPLVPGAVVVKYSRRTFTMSAGQKRVEISLATQRIRGWQGSRLVMESRISSGRNGSTPSGDFRAGPYKARFHSSSRYHNAPMPWSVQISGNVFVHGFASVPNYPASHGCIRLPLTDWNPARFFFEWVDAGTPVRVSRN